MTTRSLGFLFYILVFAGCGGSDSSTVLGTTGNPISSTSNTAQPPAGQPPAVQPPVVFPSAPVAVDDSFSALGNATLTESAAGVLANDFVNGATITAFDHTGTEGGTIDLQAGGSFSYTPAAGYVGAESFTYTLSNGTGTSIATVTLTSTGLGRFVDNSGSNGTGTQASPFNNLQDALSVARRGDTIYVAGGTGGFAGVPGGFTLPAGVKLIGEGTGLVLAQTIEPLGTPPVIGGPIVCRGDNLIQGFAIDGSTGSGIIVDSVPNVTISGNSFADIQGPLIQLDDVVGTVTIDGNDFLEVPTISQNTIQLEQTDKDANVVVTNNSFKNSEGNSTDSLFDVESDGTSALDVTFSGNDALGTIVNEFTDGLFWTHNGTEDCTLLAEGNRMSNFSDGVFEVYPEEMGAIDAVLTHNTFEGCDEPLYIDFGFSTSLVSGNVITDPTIGISVLNEYGNGTCLVTNNRVTGAEAEGIVFETRDTQLDSKVAIRNNVITNNAGSAIFVDNNYNNSHMCCDITGNTVDADMVFEDTRSGSIIVERFGDAGGSELKTVNTFTNGADVQVLRDAVIDAVAGFCLIP